MESDINTNSPRKRDLNVDIVRAFAIIAVVVGHSIYALLQPENDSVVLRLIQMFQMPLLFLVSGFSLGYSVSLSFGKNFQDFILKKIIRLLIPYFSWATIHYFINARIYKYSLKLWDYVNEIFNSDFWFLRELFLYMLIVWIVGVVLSFVIKKETAVVALAYILSSMLFILFKLQYYWIYFLIGFLLFRIFSRIKTINHLNRKIVRYVGLAISSSVLMCYCVGVIKGHLRAESSMILTLTIFMVIYLLPIRKENCVVRILVAIGKNTLGIYAVHWCLLFSPMICLGLTNPLLGICPIWLCVIITSFIWLIICDILIRSIGASKILSMILLGNKVRR